ncbi:acid phosphatase [Putridiphycobacter roseus]|uniref:acid phosphatase n=1 Tax=Putridiphycobacter roseus TaxID=2219161 RepID=A0A2W1NDS6_9FLAO|nr:tartrate-resistant acid phosphatase type 5 family protein [Putridiphycobacter roseus]PZE17575.1 acid phosphatase [Putridiphycobacter roseus]
MMKITSLIIAFSALILLSFNTKNTFISDTLQVQNNPENQNRKSLDFFVIGDWGEANLIQQQVANAMAFEAAKNPIDFIISVGDNFYPHGVRSINDKKWENTFENVYADSNLITDWYTAIGNHDYQGNVGAQLRYHKKNPRWKTTERYFSFKKSIPQSKDSVLFVFIDTNPFDKWVGLFTGGNWRHSKKKQLLWLENVLQASKEKWKIVVGHHPLYTTGIRRGQTADIQAAFLAAFEKHQVDVYFSGHDHSLQHQKPAGHTHYFVSGAGSESRGVTIDSSMTKFAKKDHGFIQAELTKDNLEIKFINANNKDLYHTTISK